MNEGLKYGDITKKVIGCAMKVHRHFGLGFPEIICKRSRLIELEKSGLIYKTEVEKDIYFEGYLVGKRRPDSIIDDKVLIELKAVSELEKHCSSQIINYLNVFGLEVGLLLNFGVDSLQFKRFVSTKKNP